MKLSYDLLFIRATNRFPYQLTRHEQNATTKNYFLKLVTKPHWIHTIVQRQQHGNVVLTTRAWVMKVRSTHVLYIFEGLV